MGLSGALFYALYDTLQPLFPYSVVNHSPCRNNSDKKLVKFLESAQNPRTFAPVSYI